MAQELDLNNQFQLVAILLPIIALVVNFAINSVQEDDHIGYRLYVGGTGLLALVPAFIALGTTIAGAMFSSPTSGILVYILISVAAIIFLSTGVVVVEVSRGLPESGRETYVFVICLLIIVTVILGLMHAI